MTREEREAAKKPLRGLGWPLFLGNLYLAIWYGDRLQESWHRYSIEFCYGWLDEIATTPQGEMLRVRLQIGFGFNLPKFSKTYHRWKPDRVARHSI